MWSRELLKTRAKAVLKTSYWKAFLVSLLIAFVGGNGRGVNVGNSLINKTNSHDYSDITSPGYTNISAIVTTVIIIAVIIIFLLIVVFRMFLGYSLEVGGRRYFIHSAQGNVDMNNVGYGFGKGKYIGIIKAMFWKDLLNFLWYLLLIIPGIIKYYSYSMVPYILAENPNIGRKRAVELSKQMTDGEKFNMWVLDLSFIGWYILGVLALFIGTLFVMPYENATKAELYLVLRQNALERGFCTSSDLIEDKDIIL